MFDTVTEGALRLRRLRAPRLVGADDVKRRTGRVCAVCKREISVDEPLFFVDREVHCAQCHDMLTYELGKERALDAKAKSNGTRWESRKRPDERGKGGQSQEGGEG